MRRVTGNVAYRSASHGSWFIRATVKAFAEHAHEQDVQALFNVVSYRYVLFGNDLINASHLHVREHF